MANLVVAGGSAGGIDALNRLVAQLPADFGATLLVAIHLPADHRSRLAEILGRGTQLPVAAATDGELIEPGTIRVAPPDRHLLVDGAQLVLSRGPRENRHRPSIDVLFRSAADHFGAQVAAVLLSGGPGDGVSGLSAVQRAGGTILVQEPADAHLPALPESALEALRPDHVAPAHELGRLLATLVERRGSAAAPSPRRTESAEADLERGGWTPSSYACPDCSGTLWELDDGRLVRFRCRIGHSFGSDALVDTKAVELEGALWSAINVMEERAELGERLAARAAQLGLERSARRHGEMSSEMRRQSARLRALVRGSG